ncbi:MBL fold metallo-hydrolase [[Clostridium] hylemonae]|nr:MBL fold metallo-hydrolase [[Clostridium] hylemonae]MCB7520942.1 MBL fold metallo-hydrolase [[Clostridium] hylemonae]QEK18119.1 Hydroxyacylglutathione hydrolase GloC [[Clostridium] hylemonae DSM 15053]BDF05134.1 MBL fold hydrolase [[Clostridium] hylemonae]
MKVEKFVTGIISTNCYLAVNEETRQTAVIDPAACPSYLMGHIKSEGLKIEAVLLTHGHFDHIMGLDGFLKEYDVPVYLHRDDEQLIKDPGLNQSGVYTSGYTFGSATYIEDNETLKTAGFEFKVLHTPGHTPGGVCYYAEAEKVLFSGDTLFQSSVGRTDFPLGSMSDLVRGIREKLMVLPDDVLVYPGHMGETTIGYEKSHNPFL